MYYCSFQADETTETEADVAKQMWLEAVRDLKEDNRRQNHISHDEWNKDYPPGRNGDKGNFEDMSDIFCLFPCCCCCFCMCRKPKKKK